MARRRIFSGSTFEEMAGYARAVVDGDWVFVSGTTGYDFATMTISDDPGEQTEQCFRNIAKALDEAGSSLALDVEGVLTVVLHPRLGANGHGQPASRSHTRRQRQRHAAARGRPRSRYVGGLLQL